MRDGLKLKGWAQLRMVRESGRVLIVRAGNLITNEGAQLTGELLQGNGSPVSYIALGGNGNTPAKDQTQLGNELNRQSIETTIQNEDEIQYSAPFRGNWSGVIREAGLFNASGKNNGVMFSRLVLPQPVDKSSSTAVFVDWVLEIA